MCLDISNQFTHYISPDKHFSNSLLFNTALYSPTLSVIVSYYHIGHRRACEIYMRTRIRCDPHRLYVTQQQPIFCEGFWNHWWGQSPSEYEVSSTCSKPIYTPTNDGTCTWILVDSFSWLCQWRRYDIGGNQFARHRHKAFTYLTGIRWNTLVLYRWVTIEWCNERRIRWYL